MLMSMRTNHLTNEKTKSTEWGFEKEVAFGSFKIKKKVKWFANTVYSLLTGNLKQPAKIKTTKT